MQARSSVVPEIKGFLEVLACPRLASLLLGDASKQPGSLQAREPLLLRSSETVNLSLEGLGYGILLYDDLFWRPFV